MKTYITKILTTIIAKYLSQDDIKSIIKESMRDIAKDIVAKQVYDSKDTIRDIVSETQKREVEMYMAEPKLNKEARIDRILAQFIKYDLFQFALGSQYSMKELREMEDVKLAEIIRKMHKPKKKANKKLGK